MKFALSVNLQAYGKDLNRLKVVLAERKVICHFLWRN